MAVAVLAWCCWAELVLLRCLPGVGRTVVGPPGSFPRVESPHCKSLIVIVDQDQDCPKMSCCPRWPKTKTKMAQDQEGPRPKTKTKTKIQASGSAPRPRGSKTKTKTKIQALGSGSVQKRVLALARTRAISGGAGGGAPCCAYSRSGGAGGEAPCWCGRSCQKRVVAGDRSRVCRALVACSRQVLRQVRQVPVLARAGAERWAAKVPPG